MFVDSHCHIDFPELAAQLEALLARMAANDVVAALCVAVNLEDFPRLLALAESDPRLFASVGVHPDYPDVDEPDVATLVARAAHPKVVAIGETGLDYYRLTDAPHWQRERFRVHIRAARAANKPLIVHMRSASEDTVRILREEGAEAVGGVMHCFTGDWASAEAAMELGFCISFSGIVTFRSAADLREVAARIPDEWLLIETDSPYLAPEPHRGKRCEPAFVRHVAERLALVRGTSVERIAEITTNNFQRIFNVLG
ncbi:MAG: TatD family hydrolase [Burkholderiaceae bacterium]|nr:TatD family hydrolase [Burkholderiaceae bacterium]